MAMNNEMAFDDALAQAFGMKLERADAMQAQHVLMEHADQDGITEAIELACDDAEALMGADGNAMLAFVAGVFFGVGFAYKAALDRAHESQVADPHNAPDANQQAGSGRSHTAHGPESEAS